MQAVILGTEHGFQRHDDSGKFRALIEELTKQYALEGVGEETSASARQAYGKMAWASYDIVAPFVKTVLGKPHVDLDMTSEEREAAGIRDRGRDLTDIHTGRRAGVHLPVFDGVRENWWVNKLEALGVNRVLVICAFPHPVHFCERWIARGHQVLGQIGYLNQNWSFDQPPAFAVKTEIVTERDGFPVPFIKSLGDDRTLQSNANDFDNWHEDSPELLRHTFIPRPRAIEGACGIGVFREITGTGDLAAGWLFKDYIHSGLVGFTDANLKACFNKVSWDFAKDTQFLATFPNGEEIDPETFTSFWKQYQGQGILSFAPKSGEIGHFVVVRSGGVVLDPDYGAPEGGEYIVNYFKNSGRTISITGVWRLSPAVLQ